MSKYAFKIWRSGFVRRWHANPDLAHTAQTNAQHQWGCAVLAMQLFPGRYDLLKACLLHDCGEVDVGDIAGPAKDADPDLRRLLRRAEGKKMEELGIDYARLPELKLIDMLEAWLWVCKHNPRLLSDEEWHEMQDEIIDRANELGVLDKITMISDEAFSA